MTAPHANPPRTWTDHERVPDLGYGDVLDSVRHLLCLALDLLTVGRIDEEIDSEYVRGLEWYSILPTVLAGDVDGSAVDEAERLEGRTFSDLKIMVRGSLTEVSQMHTAVEL